MPPQEVHKALDQLKKDRHAEFSSGHKKNVLAKLLSDPGAVPSEITIPTTETIAQLLEVLDDAFIINQHAKEHTRISIFDQNGKETIGAGARNPVRYVNFIQGARTAAYHHGQRGNYNTFLAPGQTHQDFVLPENPEIGYATVIGCASEETAIIEKIRDCVAFIHENPPLHGAKRQPSEKTTKNYGAEAQQEWDHYKTLQLSLKNTPKSIEEIAEETMADQANFHEKNNYLADLFTARMLGWAEKNLVPLEKEPVMRAAANIAFTCYFMCYYPHLEANNKGWEERAFTLCIYMLEILLGDELLWDATIPGETDEEKHARLQPNYENIQKAITENKLPENLGKSIPHRALKSICQQFVAYNGRFTGKSHPEMLRLWQDELIKLHESWSKEWDENVIDNPEVDQLSDEKSFSDFREKYLHDCPNVLKAKVEKLLTKLQENPSEKEKISIIQELKFYTYSIEVRHSIGAGMSFRTLSLFTPPEQVNEEMLKEFNDNVYLTNYYFRILNDLSGLSRALDDQENNRDALYVMKRKYLQLGYSEEDATVKTVTNLKKLLEEIRLEISSQRLQFLEKNRQLAIPMLRCDIGEIIYKFGHYRTTSRNRLRQYMADLIHLGSRK